MRTKSIRAIFLIILSVSVIMFSRSSKVSISDRVYAWIDPYHYWAKELGIDALFPKLRPYIFFGKLPVLQFANEDSSVSWKFDGDRVSDEKPRGEYRIFLVGGRKSFSGEEREEHIHKILEKHMNESKQSANLKIYNARDEHVSGQTLLLLQFGLLDFHPDMLIYMESLLDLISIFMGEIPGTPLHFINYLKFLDIIWAVETDGQFYKSSKGKIISKEEYIKNVLSTSAMFDSQLSKRGIKTGQVFGVNMVFDNLVRNYKRNLDTFFKICRAKRVPTVYVFLPSLVYKNVRIGQEMSYQKNEITNKLFLFFSNSPFLKQFMDSGAEVARLNGVPIINGSAFFEAYKGEVFKDLINLNQAGQEIFADYLHKEIKGLIN